MQYPFRVKVLFDTEGKFSKLKTIHKINHFLNNSATSTYTKWNMTKRTEDMFGSEWYGIEIGFNNHADAVHFKLGFISDGEKIDSDIHRGYQEEGV